MATSEGFGELTGRIGNHIYYKVGSQLRIRKMPTKDFSKKVKQGKSFENFREFGTLLAKSSCIGKLIRDSLMDSKADFFDQDTHHRLNALIQEATKLDDEPIVKKKRLLPGNAGLLAGFQFRKSADISSYFSDVAMTEINGEKVLKVGFVNDKATQKFPYAQLSVLILALDPAKLRGSIIGKNTQMYDLMSVKEGFAVPIANVSLEADVIYLVLLQVEPYTIINGLLLRMYEKSYQCLKVIDVMYV